MKTKYSLNKKNQLTIIKNNKILTPKIKLSINNKNQPVYKIIEPKNWLNQNNIPEKITLQGKWKIGKNHNLIFILRKTKTQYGKQKLLLKSELIKVKANAIIFSIVTQGKTNTHSLHLIQFKGKWRTGKFNRLQFLIQKSNNTSNTLTLQGIWQVKQNNLVYIYKKDSLITKNKNTHILRFNGYWKINHKTKLTYILNSKNFSFFEFKAYLETPNLIGKRNTIKYRVGIGVKGDKSFKNQIISIYGVWKLNRKTGLTLTIDYGNKKIKTVSFNTFLRINKKSKITLELKNKKNNPLGINLTLTHSFLKDNAQWFLKIIKDKKHPKVKLGANIDW